MTVTPDRFGKDHFSTLLYLESRAVDARGVPDRAHMRTDRARHPTTNKAGRDPHLGQTVKHPTILAGGEKLDDHDDWDCADDLAAAGYVTNLGDEYDRVYMLTPAGWTFASLLRRARAHRMLAEYNDTVTPADVVYDKLNNRWQLRILMKGAKS